MARKGRPAAWTAGRSQQAFTLAELLIVVGLIVLLSAVSFPMLDSTIQGYRVRTAAWQLAGNLRLARAKAVSANRRHRVCFDGCAAAVPADGYLIQREEGNNRWVIDRVVQAPTNGVHLTSNPTITFNESGEANDGTVTLANGSRTFQVRTHYTGRVKVCKESCS